MATLLHRDSLFYCAHADSTIASLCCRLDFSSLASRPPANLSSSPIGSKVLLQSSLVGCRDVKLPVDHIQAAADTSRLHSLTTRCILSPSVDIFDPLPRIPTGSGETIRPRPSQTIASARRQAEEWEREKAAGSAAADTDATSFSSPLFLYSSQSSRYSRRKAQSNRAAIQMAAATPSLSTRDFKGGVGGAFMSFAVLILGMTAVLHKSGLRGHGSTTICSTCEGYGKVPCFICGGRGNVEWEGKLKRADPCPLCFGSCTAKCSSCGGIRVYKGVPPFQQQFAQKSGNRRT